MLDVLLLGPQMKIERECGGVCKERLCAKSARRIGTNYVARRTIMQMCHAETQRVWLLSFHTV